MGNFRTAQQVKDELVAIPRRALIITTLVHESRAVQSHLSEVERVSGANGAIYQMGTFSDPAGDWAVVHAICQAGNVDAAVTAAGAYNDFGNFHVQMFVGVAGSLKEDVPIGSVVAGNYVYNAHSAKVDDHGRYSRPHSHTAAIELIQAATMLILDSSWTDLIKPPVLTLLPAASEYPCPYPPIAEIKAIASGEQVVSGGNTPTYRNIRKFLNDAAAVEMEGWGAMGAAASARTSAIVIRGISDMCAGKDHIADKQFQPIASAHAAAFAFSLLSMRSRASQPDSIEVEFEKRDNRQATAPAPDTRVEYVVNFKGTRSDWSQEKIDSVIDGLKEATGDPHLTLLRIDEGSVRIVVSVREKDIPSLTLAAVKKAAGETQDQLLGAATIRELSEADAARVALQRASANLMLWERTLPDGGWLERPEKTDIESRFRSNSSITVLLGEPGSGKSALLAAIANDLVTANAAVLAIKADFVSTDVHNAHDLQADLGLPALPGELIEQLAHLQPVFLIIDQLDALASQVDLRSDRLNVLLNLVRRVGGMPNVHILLSARIFEFNHDVRLRVIDAEAISLIAPPWHEVNAKLMASGIDADTWPQSAREVVRNPQALKTYLSLANSRDDQPFSKYQAMLEQMWRQKVATAPDGDALATLASDLAGIMAEEEALWVAASRFDARALLLDKLESAGLIVRSNNGQSVAFSHQTVFDYVLARSFVLAAGRLSSYVLGRQNSLFVRAKLWSALRYLRDAEIASYKREFLEIWRCDSLRHHLRLLLIEFLGEIGTPAAFEKVCLEQSIQSENLRAATLKSIIGSPGWFATFMRNDIPASMSGNDSEANHALRILQGAWSFAADDVVQLLRERWFSAPTKDSFTWAALDACVNWTEAVEAIAITILSRTPVSLWQVDHTASSLAVQQPEVAFRLIRAKLDFLLDRARAASQVETGPNEGTAGKQIGWRVSDASRKPFVSILEGIELNDLPAMTEAEPQKFLQYLWPWFKLIFDELKLRSQYSERDYLYPGVYDVDIDLEDKSSGNTERMHPLLYSLRIAIERVASKDRAYFMNWAQLNDGVEFMPIQRLIAHGYRAAAEPFAQAALNWIFQDTRRLQLGNIQGTRKTSAALIGAVSAYWTSEQVRDFESRIAAYAPKIPPHITDASGRRAFAQVVRGTRAHLLGVIAFDRLSASSKELLAVERRALGENFEREVTLTGGFIGSPMEAQSMSKAKDRDILKMFDEVPDNADWDHPRHWMRGGNIQLSRAFAEFAKADPPRAIRIMEQFEPKAQERAAGYALDSLAETGTHDQELQEAMLDLVQRGFGAEEFKNSAAHALEKMAKRRTQISEPLIQMLAEWLRDPASNTEPSTESEQPEIVDSGAQGQSDDDREGSILWGHGGVSFLPSGNFPVLSALASILLNGEEGRDRLFAILSEHLPRERDPKVWQALLISLVNSGGSTPSIVSAFVRKLFTRYPVLLETHEAVHFLAYAQRWDDALVHELIVAWGDFERPMMRQAQGELVGLISIVKTSDRWTTMRDQLLESGSPEAKVGLAYAGAHLWREAELRAAAGALLVRLIPGATRGRMSAILDVFRLCDDLVSEPSTLALLAALAAPEVDLSGAPAPFIVEKLQSLLPLGADVVAEIALKLVNGWRNDLVNIHSATAVAAPQLTDLAITLHRLGGASREAGVAVFEALIDIDANGARATLAEIDGRFGLQQAAVRRRVARRSSIRAKSNA